MPPVTAENPTITVAELPPPAARPRPRPAVGLIAKPLIARLQESDVIRTLGGILTTGSTADVTRLGWPTLRAGFPLMTFPNAMREMRATLTKRTGNSVPVMAVIGAGPDQDRSIAALNIALAAARDGASVLMIDADHKAHTLSDKVGHLGMREPSRLGWLSIGTRTARAIQTANGISILPAAGITDAKAGDAIRKAIAQARSAGGYDLVILDGPSLPWSSSDRKLLDLAEGLVAILPVHLDINESMEDIIAALGGAERKLVGVVLDEFNPRPSTVSETNNMLERRANPVGRAATASVPRISLGGLRLAVLDIEQTANFMIEMVFPERRVGRPLYLTSANGEVLARCSTEPMTDRLFRAADLINADGQPLVMVSRLRSTTPLPERVATTDLFHVVARKAQAARADVLHVRRGRGGKCRCRRQRSEDVSGPRGSSDIPMAISAERRCGPRSTKSTRWRRTISGWRSGFPTNRPLSRNSPRSCSMSASSRRPADCSTSCRAAGPARRAGCSRRGSNGPGGSGWSRAGCSGAISPPIRGRSICCSTGAGTQPER